MTNFSDFSLIVENLVTYFTGTYTILSIFILVVFLLTLLARGLSLRYSILFLMPLTGFLVLIGWFGEVGSSQWIINLVLIIVAFIYGAAIVKLST